MRLATPLRLETPTPVDQPLAIMPAAVPAPVEPVPPPQGLTVDGFVVTPTRTARSGRDRPVGSPTGGEEDSRDLWPPVSGGGRDQALTSAAWNARDK